MLERPLFWSAAAFAAGLVFPPCCLPFDFWGVCALATLGGAVCLAAMARKPRAVTVAFFFLLIGFACAGRLAGL
ncbi:MAG TPA: hypothetical protein VFE84_01960, partial [Patescibacteria group bacterium]|nr:hypothetical protein [Patescibacteria group bacterium]